MAARTYTTRRQIIIDAIATLLKKIDGTNEYRSNLADNVFGRIKFYEEFNQFPAVCITAGNETRDYQGGGYADRYLIITIRIFVKQENALSACEAILEDIETSLEANGQLAYYDRDGNAQAIKDIIVLSITTDEGALEPVSLGEMTCRVHY